MRGLVILFAPWALAQCLIASDPPHMHAGFSQLLTNQDLARSIGRRIAMARFSQNLCTESPENVTNTLNQLQELFPNPNIQADIATARHENTDNLFNEMQHFMTQAIRPNISLALRDVADEHIISAGFTQNLQAPLIQAGCYIRLGQSLRSKNMENLAATAFLKSGQLYATVCLSDSTLESRVDLLLSAAQCYYWAHCNEQRQPQKQNFEILYTRYFEYAHRDALLLGDRDSIAKIEQERTKIASNASEAN